MDIRSLEQAPTNAPFEIGDPADPALNTMRNHIRAEACLTVTRDLRHIAPDTLDNRSTPKAPEDASHSGEDLRILAWFNQVDLAIYLTPLQVFWCIGYVEREAIRSAGLALGWHRLKNRIRGLHPRFHFASLPTGVTYLYDNCLPTVDGLFDREPFHSNAWSESERVMEIRTEFMLGKRRQGRWTPKARTAWRYVDRLLTLHGWLPTINTDGDRLIDTD